MKKFGGNFVYFCCYGAQDKSFDIESVHEELRVSKDQQ